MAVPGDIAEDDRDLPRLRGEQVVEVAAGSRALGRSVGDRYRQPAHLSRNVGHQRRLHGVQIAQERGALTLQASRAQAGDAGAQAKRDGQEQQREDDRLAPVWNR